MKYSYLLTYHWKDIAYDGYDNIIVEYNEVPSNEDLIDAIIDHSVKNHRSDIVVLINCRKAIAPDDSASNVDKFIRMRKHLGLTQTSVANLLDKGVNTVNHWENERHPIPEVAILAMEALVIKKETGEL